MRYSELFHVPSDVLEAKGVFNADVNTDSQLHIDPSLFKNSKIPEFVGAYDEFIGYFIKVFEGIVPYAHNNQKFFNQLVKRVSFREIANTCLGYSANGTHGSGIGGKLAEQIANTIIDIYNIGICNPVVFEMMPFFEEGIGADRISDMTAYLLIRRLIAYTQRVCNELSIPMHQSVKLDGRPMCLPTYQGVGYVFVPSEVLCDLPTANSFDDIDRVCHYNEMFRRRICQAIGEQWKDFRNAPKSRIKKFLFENPETFKDFLKEYEQTSHQPYNFVKDKRHIMGRCYTISICGATPNKYLLARFDHPEQAKIALLNLQRLEAVQEISFLETDEESVQGKILKIMPCKSLPINEIENITNTCLLKFFLTRIILPEETVTLPAFEDIKKVIIEELNKALNTIYVCVAWFTDDDLRDVLLEKKKQGVDVRVIIYHDGVNKNHGVDFKEIPHIEIRSDKGGIMHRKYCIIDNHITVSGSFNWTDNATKRNDENIQIVQNWDNSNLYTRQFLNVWQKHQEP